jgi:2-dehydropantoate 2-reductase
MKIAVMGSGGLGGYMGGRLAQAGRDVTFVARGQHLQAIRHNGLQVQSPAGNFVIKPAKATNHPAEVGPVDLILLCVKSYDVLEATQLMQPMVGTQTAIIPVQNGLDHIETVSGILGVEHLVGGVAAISAHIASPGVIQHNESPDFLEFGELSGGLSARCEWFEYMLAVEGFEVIGRPDIVERMWWKFSGMCGASVFCVARGSRSLVWIPEIQDLCRQTISEVVAIARASGVPLSKSIPDEVVALWDNQTGFKPSMLVDLERNRRLELEVLNGAAVRFGKELGMPTPANDFIYACLKPYLNGPPQPVSER